MNLTAYFGADRNLFEGAQHFFGTELGITLNSPTAAPLNAADYVTRPALLPLISRLYFAGGISNDTFTMFGEQGDYATLNTEGYSGLFVFAMDMGRTSPTRSEMAELCRVLNRKSHGAPVVVVYRYGDCISLAAAERTKYVHTGREGQKPGKVSLLKDIKVAGPHSGHLRLLQLLSARAVNTRKGALTYDLFYKHFRETFNVQLLNKQFYEKLFHWYLWAVREVKFPQMRKPGDTLLEDHVHQSESVIRLLTRLLFCWFLKEKSELIPARLFDRAQLGAMLKDFDGRGEDSIFYRAILQNLFFATLSVPGNERKYIRETDSFKNKDYGNANVFRFQDHFTNAVENLKMFRDIPFLNGGLFECLDEVTKAGEPERQEIRLDGFSTSSKKQAVVPDYLFWGQHTGKDLSAELDNPRKKSETITGLIDILDNYKFTIEENTPLEEEIALDPELLGRVFENLLASYNPETRTTARKQTGSFYTPREIVNYMVDESLIATLSQTLEEKTTATKEAAEALVRNLFAHVPDESLALSEDEKSALVSRIELLKVLDPACGSGAFPMGVLHRLVDLLKKLDPGNKRWFEVLIGRFPSYMQGEMRSKLESENWDYLRKLGLIQECIYGIDIQPIAVQISKLRFFISLIVDQRIRPDMDNHGLLPLPNLDFKVVAANTLIGAPGATDQSIGTLGLSIEDDFATEFQKLTAEYFGVYLPKEKKKVRAKIEKLIEQKSNEQIAAIRSLSTAADTRYSRHMEAGNQKLIAQRKRDEQLWRSYTHLFKHESVRFFETKYFFPEVKDGFDVVIGNPPYVQIQKLEPEVKAEFVKEGYETYSSMGDIYSLFYERGFKMLAQNGLLNYITSNKWLKAGYGDKTRGFFAAKTQLNQLIDFGSIPVFLAVTVDTNILSFAKSEGNHSIEACKFQGDWKEGQSSIAEYFKKNAIQLRGLNTQPWIVGDSMEEALTEKIKKAGKPLSEWDIKINRGILTGLNEAFIIDEGVRNELIKKDPKSAEVIKPVLLGKDIKRFNFNWRNSYVIFTRRGIDIDKYSAIKKHLGNFRKELEPRNNNETIGRKPGSYKWFEIQDNVAYFGEFEKKKIAWGNLALESQFALVDEGYFINAPSPFIASDSLYLLAVMNSKLGSHFIKSFGVSRSGGYVEFKPMFVERLPVPEIDSASQLPFITLVDQILTAKKADAQADTKELERQIDIMVYHLYNLTLEEARVVDSTVGEVEWEKWKIV